MSKIKKVCIDPGHGFANLRPGVYDPGAVSGTYNEADIVLQWALTLKWTMNKKGIAVFMTRDDDSDSAPVSTRDDRAELNGCSHFVSLHCNQADSKVFGQETFYRDANDMKLAKIAQKAILETMKGNDRGVKSEKDSQHKRLAIFDFDGPACLVELEFIGGPHKMLLRSRDHRIEFAERLSDAMIEIYGGE